MNKKQVRFSGNFLRYVFVLLCVSVSFSVCCQGIRDRPFTDIDGNAVTLADYAGMKMLFIVLPAGGADSFTTQLKTFVAAYGGKVKVIGVLSQETGEAGPDKAVLKTAYKNTGIILTAAMASRKGDKQAPLIKWLTGKNENGHFDTDVKGPGQKFFVDGKGKLYAVLSPETPLSAPFISRVVNAAEIDDKPVPVKGKSKP